MDNRKSSAPVIAMAGGAIVVLILVLGTLWMGRSAGTDTERAVRSVSLLYLEELAGRREQLVEDNLTDNINTINVAIGLMPDMDGVETARRIREIAGGDAAIIILTSYNWDEIAETARAAGVDSFVAKPLFAGTVMDTFQEAFARRQALAPAHRADLKGRRVLLAEDVPVNAEIIMMILSMREMTVEHAENGRVAVDMFAARPEGYYDAILMDMRMPEMDGLTAHLSEPVEPDTLFETLENLIRG